MYIYNHIRVINGREEWTITATPKQIIVMQKKMDD